MQVGSTCSSRGILTEFFFEIAGTTWLRVREVRGITIAAYSASHSIFLVSYECGGLSGFDWNMCCKVGTRWRSWSRRCTANRKVAGSIPNGVIGILRWLNPSGRSRAPWSTQPIAEKSIRDLTWGKGGRCVGLIALPPSHADYLEILGASVSWSPKGLSRPVMEQLLRIVGQYCYVLITWPVSTLNSICDVDTWCRNTLARSDCDTKSKISIGSFYEDTIKLRQLFLTSGPRGSVDFDGGKITTLFFTNF